jgi:hypothetical protein
MTNNRKKPPTVATPSNSTKQEIFVKARNNSIKTKAKGSCKTKKRPMPQNLQLDYSQTLDTLADYRANSSLEEELADQLKESYEQYQAWGTKDSYVHLCEHVATLKGFLDCKNKLYTDNLLFASALKNFDIKRIPTTITELLAAVTLSHTGGHGLYLFDSIVYSSHLANQSPDEELVKSANEARNTAFDYLKSLGNWSSPESLKLINTKNQDLSGNASACPTNMGEGEMGLPIAPFLRWWDGPKKFHRHPILTTEKSIILSTIPDQKLDWRTSGKLCRFI